MILWLILGGACLVLLTQIVGPVVEHWLTFRSPSKCCSAKAYGYHTPMGYVRRCSRCHAEPC
jgi:hypothetical protein